MIPFLRNIKNNILFLIDKFHAPFKNIIPLQTFRYAFCGGFNTSLDIFLYFITYNFVLKKQILDLYLFSISPHIGAFLIVFPITFSTGFLLSKYITFNESRLNGRVQLLRYGIIVVGCIFLNYALLTFFVEYCGLKATLSKIVTTVIVVLYSYISQRSYTFKIAEVNRIE